MQMFETSCVVPSGILRKVHKWWDLNAATVWPLYEVVEAICPYGYSSGACRHPTDR